MVVIILNAFTYAATLNIGDVSLIEQLIGNVSIFGIPIA
jgi:hypothetical protein